MFCWKQRIRPSLLSSLWSYRNSSTQKPEELKLSQQAQRAAWAVKVIDAIQMSEPEECIYSPSLKQKLLALPNPHLSYDFQDSVKKEIFQMFQGGIKLSDQAFRQERFLRSADQYDRIVFCPNYLVTKQMFHKIKSFPYLMISGNFGISKSISLALYSILARHVNLLYYQAEVKMAEQAQQDKQSAEKLQKQFKQEIQELQQKDILRKLPKFWYWTINRADIQKKGWRSIQKSLIFQADQLSAAEKEDLRKCQSLRAFISRLIQYYPQQKVKNKVIIDQINGMASLMRDWNWFLIQKKDQIEKINELDEVNRLLLEEQIKANQKKFLQPAKELIDFFYEIIKIGNNGYLLNSSVNIETSLFKDPKLQPDKKQFPLKFLKFGLLEPLILPILGNHDQVFPIQLIYSEDLRKDWGRNDFFHFFWFEVQSYFKRNILQQKLDTARRIFLSAAQKKKGKGYYRNIYIKQYLNNVFDKIQTDVKRLKDAIKQLPTQKDLKDNLSYQKRLSVCFPSVTLSKMFPQVFKHEMEAQRTLQKQDSQSKVNIQHPLATIFSEMFDRFDIQCKKWQKERVEKFMKKGDYKQKMKFMIVVFSLAEQAHVDNKELKFPAGYLGHVLGKDVAAHFLSEEHNQQLLPINRNVEVNEIVDFLWTPAEFLELTTELIFPQLYKTHQTLFASFLLKSNKIQPLFRGIFFQLLFIYQLNPQTIIKFKMFANQNWTTDYPVKISKNSIFVSFNVQIIEQIYKEKRQDQQSNQTKAKKLFYLETNKQAQMPAKKPTGQSEEKKIIPYDVDLHFQEIIKQCNANFKCYISGLPYYNEAFVHNNKCVDFVLAIKTSQQTTIYTFDLTVSTKVSKKITDAQHYLKNLAAQSPKLFKIVHIILAPQEACQESIEISKNLSIRFSDIDSFEMEKVTYQSEYTLLKVLQDANRKLRQQKARQPK